ncbi:MAG: YkgJ family cysteine cluster protein [Methanomassiliicoccales archaeon]
MEVDLSDLQGRRFRCLESCQLCCLHQPELLEEEVRFFRKEHPGSVVLMQEEPPRYGLALRNLGPCRFLRDGYCSIYEDRPRFCRQFPFHIHVGDRVKVEGDLSCRGLWGDEGTDAHRMADQLIRSSIDTIESVWRDTSRLYREFRENCLEGRAEVRERFQGWLPHLSMESLGAVLESSAEEEVMGEPPVDGQVDPEEVVQAAMEASLQSLESRGPRSAPVYCDPDGRWNIFYPEGEEILWMMMDQEGELHTLTGVDPLEVEMEEPEGEARELLLDYLSRLNRRDSLLGYVYYLIDLYGCEDPLPNTYYGVMATSALDLLWRVNLFAHLRGEGPDWTLMREGIIFYDVDRLGAPTLGTFV